jgi:hypothetical protein
MCDFVSWIEVKDKVGKVKNYYLTGNQVFDTPRGQMLRDWCRNSDDYVGHGAIRFYYELDSGIGAEKECTNFAQPDNFPPEIVVDIKAGKMRGLGTPEGLLRQPVWAEYIAKRQPVWAEYKAKEQTALDEYEAKRQTALAEYIAKRQPALDEYEAKRQPAWDEYEAKEQPAWDEYKAKEQPAWDEYKAKEQPAWDEYKAKEQTARDEYIAKIQTTFWDLFVDVNNRATAWLMFGINYEKEK